MAKTIANLLLIILFVGFAPLSKAQNSNLINAEKKLFRLYNAVWAQQRDGDPSSANEHFRKELQQVLTSNSASIAYSFKSLVDSNMVRIVTSSDEKFRIYSWDTWTGGTMHFFDAIFQWKTNSGDVLTQYKNGASVFYSKIYSLTTGGKTFYMPISNAILSTRDAVQVVDAFTINRNKITPTDLFKTKRQLLNSIRVEYDFSSVVDRPERPVELIKYDSNKQVLYIPVVKDGGKVLNSSLLYQLKGNYLEFVGTQKGN